MAEVVLKYSVASGLRRYHQFGGARPVPKELEGRVLNQQTTWIGFEFRESISEERQ